MDMHNSPRSICRDFTTVITFGSLRAVVDLGHHDGGAARMGVGHPNLTTPTPFFKARDM